MECAIAVEEDIVCIRWKDNSTVTLLSNEYGMKPIQKCSRYLAKEKKKYFTTVCSETLQQFYGRSRSDR